MKIHIIFPTDPTTDFLEEIIRHLERHNKAMAVAYRIETIAQQLDIERTVKSIPDEDVILFMGHGTSNALSGPYLGTASFGPMISESQLNFFRGKRIILLTCRSEEYINNFGRDAKIRAAIGFPNLITDSYELLYPEDGSHIANVTEEDIAAFRKVIVDIIKYSLVDFVKFDLSFYQLFRRIRIRAQKELISYYAKYPDFGKLAYGEMINDICQKMNFFGN